MFRSQRGQKESRLFISIMSHLRVILGEKSEKEIKPKHKVKDYK